MLRLALAALACVALTVSAQAQGAKSPAGASVRIISPQDGATVSGKFKVVFGLSGMGIAPAGVEKENTGHHHLFINRKITSEELEYSLPAEDNLIHFGKGQTETTIELPPGKHTLQMVLGDHNHIPHDPPVMSKVITVTVK